MFSIILLLFLPYCLAEIWIVHVYTGNERFAGTDSNVYIRLYNEEGDSTSEVQLTHYNWLPEKSDFPLRNLFEVGARERFRIQTEFIGEVSKIQIRQNNFPALQADWLLDQVIVERNRDNTKYRFNCNCWLRARKPYITISAVPDERTNNKNKNGNSSSKNNQTFVIILVVLITLIVCIFCCFNEYRRRQRHRSSSLTDNIEQLPQNPALLDGYNSSSSRPSSPTSGPQLWVNTMRRWKNFRHGLPSYNHARTTQSATAATAVPSDDPPAYEDLYPTSNVPINSALTSNL